MSNKVFSIHRSIVHEKEVEVYLLSKNLTNYATELATAGVPQVEVIVALDGGTKRQSTAGAVPQAVNGLAVVVPPVMLFVCPQPVLAGAFQVVTNVSTVDVASTAAVTLMLLLVYK
jgi:hypothetical protein